MMERFGDGNMADVYRVGNAVRKQRSPWWHATRQVLNHLEQVGYQYSPRILTESEQSVDLSYIPGSTVPADLGDYRDEFVLQTIGQQTRELHDALDGFRLTAGTDCVPWPVPPDGDHIVCHNDLSPWNAVFDQQTFQGFIDWDLVSYGTREWELAWVCWRWAPLYPVGERTSFDAEQQAARCRLLLEAYGFEALDLTGFLELIDRRMWCALEVVEQLGAQGVPGFDRLLATGMHLSAHDDRAWFANNRDLFSRYLQPH